jgi:hypothetical protein
LLLWIAAAQAYAEQREPEDEDQRWWIEAALQEIGRRRLELKPIPH